MAVFAATDAIKGHARALVEKVQPGRQSEHVGHGAAWTVGTMKTTMMRRISTPADPDVRANNMGI